VTVHETQRWARALRAQVESLRCVVAVDALVGAPGRKGGGVTVEAGDTALLQYTSGSTAHPKGVVLSHSNLLANLRAMGDAVGVAPSDVFVSWLPLYHDMGLIGAWLGSLYHGFALIVMPPLAFLARPVRWLQAIHDHRASLSGAPNFAYELCVRRIQDRDLEGLDLGSWRWAFNGAEPVSPSTIERFRDRFAQCGLRPEALAPVYGLAESAVGLTFPPPARGPLIDRIDREAFARSGRAHPTTAMGSSALRFPSCGAPLPGHEIRVVDAVGHEVGERQEGRIEFSGPSATSGYYRDPEATARLFDGAWLDTGDLGYIAGGELYVSGRVKDLIIRAGRTLHPDEFEEAIGDLPGVRKGCVAVFASTDHVSGTERVVVLAETRETSPETRAALSGQIRARATDLAGVPPDEIVLAPPHTVLKTSSGKIRRAASRDLYERGAIGERPGRVWRQLWRLTLAGVLPTLRRWRRVGSSLCYSAAVWTLLLTVSTPVWLLVTVLPGRSRRRRLVRSTTRLLVRLSGSTLMVTGTERLPNRGPFVLAANHPSFLDGLALVAAVPVDLTFVAASEFSRQRIAGTLLRRLGAVFVERSRTRGTADVQQLQDALHRREALAVFPEGRLSRVPGLRPFHLGAFLAAAEAGVPVVPVAIRGTRSMLRAGHRLVRRGLAEVEVGAAIEPVGHGWHAAVNLQQAARAAILERCGEPSVGSAT
jgi:1-acyl-sn-glycerol-3-phosphate acyltransferase